MSSPRSSPLVDLGYLGPTSSCTVPPTISPRADPRIPSDRFPTVSAPTRPFPTVSSGVFQSVGEMMSPGQRMMASSLPSSLSVERPASGTLNFVVSEESLNRPFTSKTPLEQLIQSNYPPVFTSPPIPQEGIEGEVRFDEIMEKLLQGGYVIEYRMYDNKDLTHLLATTKRGDKVLIQVDSPPYQSTFPQIFSSSDIQMQLRPSMTLVPQETKVGAMQCLNYDVCGVAFICKGDICITEKSMREKSKQISYTEKNYTFQTTCDIGAGIIGRALVAYPIIKLSSILEDPEKAENNIASVSEEIHKLSVKKLHKQHKQLEEALDKLTQKIRTIRGFLEKADFSLDADIEKLTKMYNNLKGVSPDELCDEDRDAYYMVMRNLASKKNLRTKLINSMSAVYAATGQIQGISKDLCRLVDPLIQEHARSSGKLSD